MNKPTSAPNLGVATTHQDYDYFRADWTLLRDAYAGERMIREAGPTYVQPLDSHQNDADAYDAYLRRGTYLSTVSRTVEGMIGLAFRKHPQITFPDDSPIANWLKAVDGNRMTITDAANKMLRDKLLMGRAAIFVDFPEVSEVEDGSDLSVAEAAEMGIAPLLTTIPAEDIINWTEKSGRIVFVSFKEEFAYFDHEAMEEEAESRIRVLKLDADGVYVQQVWVSDIAGGQNRAAPADKRRYIGTTEAGAGYVLEAEFTPLLNGEPMAELPIFFAEAGGSPQVCKSPMFDLADLSIKHYRKSCDYSYGLHMAALPTPYAIGVSDEESGELEGIGPGSLWTLSNDAAKVGFLEVAGPGFKAVADDIDRTERQMVSMGARMLAPAADLKPESGIALSIRSAADNALLTSSVADVERAIQKAVAIAEQFYGLEPGSVTFAMNRDFVAGSLGANEVKTLHDMLIAGSISYETFVWKLKQGEWVANDVTASDERERIEDDAAGLAGIGE